MHHYLCHSWIRMKKMMQTWTINKWHNKCKFLNKRLHFYQSWKRFGSHAWMYLFACSLPFPYFLVWSLPFHRTKVRHLHHGSLSFSLYVIFIVTLISGCIQCLRFGWKNCSPILYHIQYQVGHAAKHFAHHLLPAIYFVPATTCICPWRSTHCNHVLLCLFQWTREHVDLIVGSARCGTAWTWIGQFHLDLFLIVWYGNGVQFELVVGLLVAR